DQLPALRRIATPRVGSLPAVDPSSLVSLPRCHGFGALGGQGYYYLGRYSEDPSDPVEAAMQQQLDRCRRPPHRRRDVVDPHVLLVPQHHRDALSRGKSLHHRPDLAQLVALGSDLLEWRTGRGKLMLLFDVLHRPARAVPVPNQARRDLIHPPRPPPPR